MTFAIYTLGCKVNAYESEFMTHLFKSKGYKQVDYKDKADIYIINTCTVTNTSDNKSKKIIKSKGYGKKSVAFADLFIFN